MASVFDAFALEIISLVGSHLDIASLRSLRLTSKFVKTKFTPVFLSYIATQDVDLATRDLRRLIDIASSCDMRHRVRTVNLTCLYYHVPPPYEEQLTGMEVAYPRTIWGRTSDDDIRALSKSERESWVLKSHADQAAFSGACMYELLTTALRGFGNLDQITLEAKVICGPNLRRRGPEEVLITWRRLWAQTNQAFRVVMSAISYSRIKLESLVIYQNTKKCSAPVNEINNQLLAQIQADSFPSLGCGLSRLSISLATTVVPIRPLTEDD
jgi:hypothetical protein